MSVIGSTVSLRRPASATALKDSGARKPHRSGTESQISRPRTPSTSVGSAARSLSSSALQRFQDDEQRSHVGSAVPVASSLGLVSVPSDVVREGLLRIPFAPSIGREPIWTEPFSPNYRSNHIGMEERPGPGWDFTNAGLSALRLPTQAAEGHVAEFARNCALQSRTSIRAYEGQRRALPLREWSEVQNVSRHRETMLRDLHQKSNPDTVKAVDRPVPPVPVRPFLPFQEDAREARCSSPIRAKYCSLHPREQTRLRRNAEQRSVKTTRCPKSGALGGVCRRDPGSMSEAVAKKNGTLPKERPRFAWWRNLHCQANRTWEGDGSSTFVHLPVVKRASPHLKWAKQVHTQQQTWLAQHCKLCKPLPKRSVGARVPRPRGPKRSRALRESTGSLPTLLPLFGTVLQWATDLRGDATELAARAKEERRELQQRRACGLQRLRETQQQWRRDQRGRQKQRQPSPEASPPSTAHEVFKPGRVRQSLESVESEDESSSDQSSKSSFGDGENSDQFGPIDRFDRPSFAESTSGSSSAEGHATFTEQRQPVAQTSMLRRNSVQRQGLLTQPVVGITAKDAEGGDISLEELFDAGSEDARQAEVHVSKVNTLAADDLMISLLTRNISGSDQEGFRRAATPDVLPTALHEEFAASTRRKCETWRAEFPLEVLDQLAAAFDSWQEEDGCRKSSVRNLCQVLRYTLGWPPKILQEVLQDQSQEELYFKRLSDLLELMREALQLAEMEEPDVLWSDWDLNLVKESFRRFASKASSTMPVVNLFQAIHVLGFEELEVDSPDRQRWLAGITKEVLARKVEDFLELEAEEVGQGEEELEGSELDELIDDSGAAKDDGKSRAALRRKLNREDKELEQLQKEVAARERGPLTGSARLFSSAKLDQLEQKYQELEERAKRGEDIKPEFPSQEHRHSRHIGVAMSHGTPVPVYSIFCSPHLKNFIYLEAHKEADIRAFTKGIRGISQYTGLSLVPTDQMALVFSAAHNHAQKTQMLCAGDWVRMKRGLYMGDLAMIEEIEDENFMVKLKPRIGRSGGKSSKRAPPAWFNRADLEARQEVIVNTEPRRTQKGYRQFYTVNGEAYRDGFLFKSFKRGWFDSGDQVRPSEHEVQDWRNAPAISANVRPELDLLKDEKVEREAMPPPPVPAKVLAPSGPSLREGDKVIVISGDVKNLIGVVINAVSGSTTVLIRALNLKLDQDMSISTLRLCKYLEVGDYVNVIAGEHKGDAGHVERVDLGPKREWGPHTVVQVLTSDFSSFRASVNDLHKGIEKPETTDQIGEFHVGQLVMVAGRSEGRAIITRLEAGSRALVLGQDGVQGYADLAELQPVELPKRHLYKRQDRVKHRIVPGAMVKAPRTLSGKATPIQAEVLWIHQNTLFLKAVEGLVGEKAYLVAPGDKCEFVWNADDLPSRRPQQTMRLPEMSGSDVQPKQMTYGITMASEMSFLRPQWHKKLGLAQPTSRTKGTFLNKGTAVRITGGKYKGYRGEIRDLLGEKARISLLAQTKLVEVPLEHINHDTFTAEKYVRWPGSQQKTPWSEPMPAPGRNGASNGDLLPGQMLGQRCASRASLSVETSRRESWSAGPTSRVGAGAQLSFRDFLRVASRALRELEKEMRIDEFRAETKAVKIGNYGLLELEDHAGAASQVSSAVEYSILVAPLPSLAVVIMVVIVALVVAVAVIVVLVVSVAFAMVVVVGVVVAIVVDGYVASSSASS
eukprot:s243_g4.t1